MEKKIAGWLMVILYIAMMLYMLSSQAPWYIKCVVGFILGVCIFGVVSCVVTKIRTRIMIENMRSNGSVYPVGMTETDRITDEVDINVYNNF